jgi:hypothetical protein
VSISAVDCVQPAIQHTRDQLFRPFRFGQWSRLALVGFLAAELHSSGCNIPNFPANTHPRRGNEFLAAAAPFPHIDPSRLAQFAGLIIAAVLLAFIVGIIFLYISSVFRFILYESVLKKHCSISEGWNRWHRTGRRYFLWQIVFVIAEFLFLGVLIGVPVAVAVAMGWFRDAHEHMARTVLGALFLLGLILVFALIAAVVQVLAKDFLVPIMAFDEVDFADGWSRLLALIRPEPGKFVIYLLLKIGLALAAAIVFGILTLIPVVIVVAPVAVAAVAAYKVGITWTVTTVSLAIIGGTVLMFFLIYLVAFISAPATVFFPAFSIYFFAPRYAKLAAILYPAPAAPQTPIVPETPPQTPPPELPPLPPTPAPIG